MCKSGFPLRRLITLTPLTVLLVVDGFSSVLVSCTNSWCSLASSSLIFSRSINLLLTYYESIEIFSPLHLCISPRFISSPKRGVFFPQSSCRYRILQNETQKGSYTNVVFIALCGGWLVIYFQADFPRLFSVYIIKAVIASFYLNAISEPREPSRPF